MSTPAENDRKCCNRLMTIGDDYGDNETTIRCQLPAGHGGPHQESYSSDVFGTVTITFEKGHAPVLMRRLRHMVPSGESCVGDTGEVCPFRAFVGVSDAEKEFACYLSGAGDNVIQPSEVWRACDD